MKRRRWLLIAALGWMAAFGFSPVQAASATLSVEEALGALGEEPMLGKNNAPVTVVEFSDFQCSFCRKFWAETLPKLKETYIEKGQARFLYRHFAILGKLSVQAAQASECAAEQGKFWPYHDRLFQNQGALAFTAAKLKRYARELGLKEPTFNQCLGSGKYGDKIEGETAVAAFLGARGTPAFFVNGRLLVGAQPFDVFQTAIEEEMRKGGSKKKGR
jgi:protein-disulfide isomerase